MIHFRKTFRILILFGLGICCNCINPIAPNDETLVFDVLHVHRVTAPDSAFVQSPFEINVIGHLPNNAWSFDHFDLFYEDSTLTVMPIGQMDKNVNLTSQQIIPFEENATFIPPSQGLLNIVIFGKSGFVQTQTNIIPNPGSQEINGGKDDMISLPPLMKEEKSHNPKTL